MLPNRTCAFSTGLFLFYYFQTVCYNKNMSDNKTLNKAKREKYNEYYTRYEDIDSEIQAYLQMNPYLFKDKVIYCPCDDFEQSNFAKYFITNFDNFQLAKLICTGMSLTDDKGKYLVMTKNNTDSGYLKADGDFRSDEVKEYYKEADFIITNPPFSLFLDFMSFVFHTDCQFAIIGNINACTQEQILGRIMANELWLGYRQTNHGFYFHVPQDYRTTLLETTKQGSGYKIIHNEVCGRLANACWFTNIDHAGRYPAIEYKTQSGNIESHPMLKKKLIELCGEPKYPTYDTYNALEVPYKYAIPTDYQGIFGVPVTFLGDYNPKLFEIVGMFNNGNGAKYDLDKPIVKGRILYKRLAIQWRKQK